VLVRQNPPDILKIYKQWEGFEEHISQNDQKLTIYRIVQEQMLVFNNGIHAGVNSNLWPGGD